MKKTKAIAIKKNKIETLALLLTAPLLIALVYFFFTPANAWGLENDHRLKRNPGNQGWQELRVFEAVSHTDSIESHSEQDITYVADNA